MLRYTIGDSLFFEVMKSYATDDNFKYKNAATADFNAKVNEISGDNYDWFFDQWVYAPNHPKYQNTYTIEYDGQNWNVDLIINQTQQNAGFFKMPVELQIDFSDGSDTLLVVANDVNNQSFNFEFTKEPTSLLFDPNRNIVLKFASTIIVSVKSDENFPLEFSLGQNYPNPFNPTTTIRFTIPELRFTILKVYDVLGNEIATLFNEELPAGKYEVDFNSRGLTHLSDGQVHQTLPSGIYFYKLRAGNYVETKKMILMK